VTFHTCYRTTKIDGLSIFYREAGPKDAPALLLLHGLPSSSRMFEPLFARLSDRYHLVAPDYPGFGHSDWPDPKQFSYTFDHYAEIMNHFAEALGLSRYTLYMQDYGGPVGFRMALVHPDRIEALIVQDAVAHNEGLGANWKPRRAFWADRAGNDALRTNLLSLPTTRTRHIGNDPNVERYDPDLWTDEFAFLNQPGQADIQSDLFYDYRTNVDAYPSGRPGCARKNLGFSSSGANTTSRSSFQNRRPIAATYRMPKSTSSTRAISHLIPPRIRLRRSSAVS
jgi:pimeloyl-ACP methyl ester carboxylesterase